MAGKSRKLSSLPVVLATVLSMALLVAVGLDVRRHINELGTLWHAYTNRSVAMNRAMDSLANDLGYGGFIHNVKNWVIRRDARYLALAEANHAAALESLDTLSALLPDTSSQALLGAIRRTLGEYKVRLSLAADLPPGASVAAVDAVAQTADTRALAALDSLQTQLLEQYRADIAGSDAAMKAAHMALTRGALALVVITVLLGAVIALNQRLSRAFEREALIMADLRAAQAKAEQESAAKSIFLANMSHELRTPLNGVLGMARLLGDEDLTPEQAEKVAVIHGSGEHLLRTISDILDVSKLEAGKVELDCVDFDLAAVVREVVSVQAGAAAAKQIALEADITGSVTRRSGDPHRLAQILHNLLSNAIKFSPDQSAVRVVARLAEPDRVHVAVIDNGIGMTAEAAARIFKPFEQASASTARESGGAGLGLSIVHGLVTAMGGTVRVDSSPERGSVFTVDLALGAAKAAAQQPAMDMHRDVGLLRGLRVLAADDNEVNRMILTALLERLGVDVVMASGGAAAIACFEQQPAFDLVLLDIVMPGLDGPATLDRLKALAATHRWRLPPVVACTAQAMPDQIEALLARGFDGHVAKPFAEGTLERTLFTHAAEAALGRASTVQTLAKA